MLNYPPGCLFFGTRVKMYQSHEGPQAFLPQTLLANSVLHNPLKLTDTQVLLLDQVGISQILHWQASPALSNHVKDSFQQTLR